MNDRLDQLLASAAPEITMDDPALDTELQQLVAATAVVVLRPRRRQRRIAAGVAAGLLVAGGASAAAAAPLITEFLGAPEVLTVVREVDGQVCTSTFALLPFTPAIGFDDPGVVMAREYLLSLDADSLDLDEARQEMSRSSGLGWTEGQLDSIALSNTISRMVFAELERQGHPGTVSIRSGHGCEPASE